MRATPEKARTMRHRFGLLPLTLALALSGYGLAQETGGTTAASGTSTSTGTPTGSPTKPADQSGASDTNPTVDMIPEPAAPAAKSEAA